MKVPAALVAALFLATVQAAEKPNVIVILVDDLGWMDLSCQGSDYSEALKAAGYQSGCIGKWHLGDPAWYPPGPAPEAP